MASASTDPFARQRNRDPPADAQKEKTPCAPREPQKVLVVELFCSSRCAGCPTSGTVLTTSPNRLAGDLLPFRVA
jgi:hypothetical protein